MEEYGVFRGKYSGILHVYKEHIGELFFTMATLGAGVLINHQICVLNPLLYRV